MNRRFAFGSLVAALVVAGGCAEEEMSGPPEIRYDVSVCERCNMIISDARYATATIIRDERGRFAPLLFDDFNCQALYEAEHLDQAAEARWVHDHAGREWVAAESAHYVLAPSLRTPMASHTAAFADEADARAFAAERDGEVLDFASLWERLGRQADDPPAAPPDEPSGTPTGPEEAGGS